MANKTEPSEMQRAFAVAYVDNGGNAAKAARAAGYAANSARVIGSRLLDNPRVQSLIRESQFKMVNGPLTSAALATLRTALDPAIDVPWSARLEAARTVLDRGGIVLAEQPEKKLPPGATYDLAELASKLAQAAAIATRRKAALEVKPGAAPAA
jgi:hypothetical protein